MMFHYLSIIFPLLFNDIALPFCDTHYPLTKQSKILLSLTIEYFKAEESVGERSTCIVMGFTYLLISMMCLIVDESKLELGLETAYSSFNESASSFLNGQGLKSR